MITVASTLKYDGYWLRVRFSDLGENIWNVSLVINKSKRTICDWENHRKNKRTRNIQKKKSKAGFKQLSIAGKMIINLMKKLPKGCVLYVKAENKRIPVLNKHLVKMGFIPSWEGEKAEWVLITHQTQAEELNCGHTS